MTADLKFLKTLHIESVNSGAFAERWLAQDGKVIESVSPVNDELIAKVRCATIKD